MKKFITYISMQPERGLCKVKYEPVEMELVRDPGEVYFPISVLVHSCVQKDEKIEILCMLESGNEDEVRNLGKLVEEVDRSSKEIGFEYSINKIEVSPEESVESQLKTFESLISNISDGDKLYACSTYGTKPIPIVEMMALNYAYRVKEDVSVEKVVYGKVIRNNGVLTGAKIYDITALFSMNQIVNHLAEQKIKNPEKAIRMLLDAEG